jgi:hypothetical protein
MSVADEDDDDDILQDTRSYCEIINKRAGGQLVSRRPPHTYEMNVVSLCMDTPYCTQQTDIPAYSALQLLHIS